MSATLHKSTALLGMTDILYIQHREVVHGPCGWSVEFQAVVDDVVQTSCATLYDPPEFGSAVCSGSLLLADDDPLPQTDDEFAELAEQVATWTPINDPWL